VALIALASACADPVTPTGPTMAARPATVSVEFPPVSRPARIYLFADAASYPVSEITVGSRYVLYDDGTFALQYLRSRGSSEYRGTYKEANGLLTFEWEGWSAAGPWGATALLGDDSLTVRYNLIMELTDFENAVYLRTR
jgi:hypothetical protein